MAFAGTFKPWHGLDLLVDAVAGARGHGAALRLLLIGDGPDLAATRRRAADALAQQYAANVAADVEASHAEPTGGCGSGGGCGGCGGGGGCGSADDARTDEERAAAKAAVTVTRVD